MTRREQLEEVRDRLVLLLASSDERTAPALARELRATLAELDSLPDAQKATARDDLKARRAARKTEAQAGTRPEGAQPGSG